MSEKKILSLEERTKRYNDFVDAGLKELDEMEEGVVKDLAGKALHDISEEIRLSLYEFQGVCDE